MWDAVNMGPRGKFIVLNAFIKEYSDLSKISWVGEGPKYASWIGDNICYMASKVDPNDNGAWKLMSSFTGRALSLGYTGNSKHGPFLVPHDLLLSRSASQRYIPWSSHRPALSKSIRLAIGTFTSNWASCCDGGYLSWCSKKVLFGRNFHENKLDFKPNNWWCCGLVFTYHWQSTVSRKSGCRLAVEGTGWLDTNCWAPKSTCSQLREQEWWAVDWVSLSHRMTDSSRNRCSEVPVYKEPWTVWWQILH